LFVTHVLRCLCSIDSLAFALLFNFVVVVVTVFIYAIGVVDDVCLRNTLRDDVTIIIHFATKVHVVTLNKRLMYVFEHCYIFVLLLIPVKTTLLFR